MYAIAISITLVILEIFLLRITYLKEEEKFNDNVKLALIESDKKLENFYAGFFILNDPNNSTTYFHKENKKLNFNFQYVASNSPSKTNYNNNYNNKAADSIMNLNLNTFVSKLESLQVNNNKNNLKNNISNEENSFLLLKISDLSESKIIDAIVKNKFYTDSIIRDCFARKGIVGSFDIDIIKSRNGKFNKQNIVKTKLNTQYSIALFTKSNKIEKTLKRLIKKRKVIFCMLLFMIK